MTVLVLDNPELIARLAALEAEQAARQEAENFRAGRVEHPMADTDTTAGRSSDPHPTTGPGGRRTSLALVG